MRKHAGFDLTRHRGRAELRGARVSTSRTRIANQRRPINATEFQRFVTLNAITLGAAFHFGVRRLDAAFALNIRPMTINGISSPTEGKRRQAAALQNYCGRLIRFTKSLNRGSPRRGSIKGSTFNRVMNQSCARYTLPIPPSPILETMRYCDREGPITE